MELLIYAIRCVVTTMVAWLSIRIIGRRSISQMTAYDFAAIMVISNVAAEPLVYKVESKSLLGCLIIAFLAVVIGRLSLSKTFYNLDSKPSILIVNGKIDRNELTKNRLNLPFLLSLLRLKGYANVSEVEFGILEPTGNLSILPKSQNRPVQPRDLKLDTDYEGLALPLIIDGEIQYSNLKYAGLSVDWLNQEIKKAGLDQPEEIFLAELKSTGELYVDLFQDKNLKKPQMF